MIAYPPAVLTYRGHDGALYIRAARLGLGQGAREPLGYPVFLRALHAVSHELAFTIGIQHALGLVTGTLLFLTARRLGAGRWLALVPAAVVWLGGDELFLEHAPLSEALFTPLLAATIYCGVRSLADGPGWLLALGALAVALLAVRSVALPLPLFVIGWVALARWRTRMPVWRAVALVAAASLVTALAYAALEKHSTGHWTLAAADSGWVLYARAAQFADCRDFTPPKGTATLCDSTPASERLGPTLYHWHRGPAVAVFGPPPGHDSQVQAFAEAAILHQPLDFLKLAGTDFVRYFDPAFGRHPVGDFAGPEAVAFPSGTPALDPEIRDAVAAYYGPVASPGRGEADGLRSYQSVMRVSGPMLLVLLLVGLWGLVAAKGRRRWEIALPVTVALALLVVPTIGGASWRYAVPAEGALAVAAAAAWHLAAPAALPRLRLRRPAQV
jgi:hypothetical protein